MTDLHSYRVEPDAEFADRLERELLERLRLPAASPLAETARVREVPLDADDVTEAEIALVEGRRGRSRIYLVAGGLIAAGLVAVLALIVRSSRESQPADAPPAANALANDLRGRLSENSEEVAFVVSSPAASYWRLTALTDFDGTTWTSRSDTADASGPLSQSFEPGAVDTETVTQTFEITNLSGSWMPAAFAPIRVYGPDGIIFDAETASLITASEASDGLRYTVESVLPRYDVAELRAANTPPARDLAERYLVLPADFPVALAEQAREITAGASTRYDQAIALQNWFRSFTYDLSFRAGHSQNAMQEFLALRRGYCEQFAGTYAAFARVLGLPSRIAVGFTQGEQRDDGRYYVQGRHAHAWPEIYFDGVGWVPFEPTPGRGNPAAVQYTGVAPAQDNGGG